MLSLLIDRLRDMGTSAYTHVVKYDGGVFAISIGSNADRSEFADPLSRLNGTKPWALTLFALPDGLDHGAMIAAGREADAYLQAGGSANAMTVQIRKPGGQQWDVESVRYIVGRPHNAPEALDVPITLPRSVETVSSSEVFGAEEAADVFFGYYRTGNIPPSYVLRPVEGYTADGHNIDLRSGATE
ncbi:Uncharacterised protein [Mycobacteroides abscessus subsp. abscessus]|nr:Uncharacterised protein [Mycobacteroides abscessus subsp. abscessus]SHU98817.1 Uncharacterised protein [Mycobacteroides abscessus subsp. abscessus]SHV60009.1 Uncharacterised protein [Mycobacteroides abscessus subsp. abscessus]SHV82272.1 Uncharacterised protein [Mycobacteroides abscessus subsp. abscessus]SHW22985.1 Uncharacterised protein [Mycobacteroides abscessus subsp. abscessus]